MLKRVVMLTIATVLGCAFFASQAAAAPVQCGDVITEDLKLEADLTDCPDDGLVVGADRITINLNGHEVSSECQMDECIGRVGIDNSGGYDRVRIRNGRVAGFEQTIRLVGANRNTLADLEVDGGIRGLDPSMSLVLDHSHRNLIRDSEIVGGDPAGTVLSASDHNKFVRSRLGGGGVIDIRNGDGIHLLDGSDANTVTKSMVGGSGSSMLIEDSARNSFRNSSTDAHFAAVILSDADRTLVVGNELNGGQGWSVLAHGNRNTIRNNDAKAIMQLEGNRNLLASNRIEAAAFDSSEIRLFGGDRNVIRGNEVFGGTPNGPGILIAEPASRTSLVGNSVRDGREDGIRVDAPGTLVRGNAANDNAALGINAVDGVIDGGGNHASGNGDPRQCVGVVCTP